MSILLQSAVMDNNKEFIPLQPYFHKELLNYKEIRSAIPSIALFFCFDTDKNHYNYVSTVPDNCIDLMMSYSNEKIKVNYCGTVLRPISYPLDNDARYFCVRFTPNSLENISGISAKELIKEEVIIEDTKSLEYALAGQIFQHKDFYKQIEIFCRYYVSKFTDYSSNKLIDHLIQEINNAHGQISVEDLSQNVHYSYSYIYNQFYNHVGISPKLYCRIARFQYVMHYMLLQKKEIMICGEDLGSYDQSHFYKEFKTFAGKTPIEFINTQK